MIYLQPLDRMRLQRGVEHLHSLGARATAEALAEVASRIGGLGAIMAILNDYQALSPQKVRRAGGDRFPSPPMREVGR